jgi:hypothetical protein
MYFGNCLLGAAAGIQKTAWNYRRREKQLALAGNRTPILASYSPYILNTFNEHALKIFYLLTNISHIFLHNI